MFVSSKCVGTLLGRDKVSFLHSSLYGAMFWICDENSLDDTLMFYVGYLFYIRLHSTKAFSAPHPAPPVGRLGMHRELGGCTAGTADPS